MPEINDWIGLNNGIYGTKAGEFAERIIENLIMKYVHPGDVAIDCGAADGRMLRLMLNAVGSDGRAVAFEPIPHVFSRLKELFPQGNAELFQMCVSDSNINGSKFFYVKNRRWISSLSPDNLENYEVEELSVSVTTLDSIEFNQGVHQGKKVAFIKLDIEGAELMALRGGKSLIARDKPFIVFENSLAGAAKSFGYSKNAFFEFFDEMEYRLFDVMGTPLTPDLWTFVGKKVCWNFVAVHKEDPRLDDFVGSIEDIRNKARDSLGRPQKK